jgi:hypothetical protein
MSAILPYTLDAPSVPLTEANTVEMAQVSHRLALGIQWRDAVSQFPVTVSAPADMVTDLESVGQRPCPLRLDAHGEGRYAIRHDGRLAKLLARAQVQPEPVDDHNPADDADGLLLTVRVYGRRHRAVVDYQSGNDPRVFVPRRLAFMPVLSGGIPTAATDNIRQAWLWPGAAYPVPSRATVVRGRIQRKQGATQAVPASWARVVVTRPGGGAANFSKETQLGWAHADDRGEFLLILGASAVPGGVALPTQVSVNVWVFLPPVSTTMDPAHPLDSVSVERAGTVALDDVLKGLVPPTGYVRQAAIPFDIRLGVAQTMSESLLLFA